MAGRFFTAAVLFAAAFASDNSTASSSSNSTASTFSYDVPADEVANTPATDDYGTQLSTQLIRSYRSQIRSRSLTSHSDTNL
jgi:hypothetical protein